MKLGVAWIPPNLAFRAGITDHETRRFGKQTKMPPEEKSTEQLLTDLNKMLEIGFKETNLNIKELDANLGLAIHEIDALKDRVGTIETRMGGIEGWRQRNSERVKGLINTTSSADLSNEAAIAAEIVQRQDLQTKVDSILNDQKTQLAYLQTLIKVTENPWVRRIATLVAYAAATWIALRLGVHLPAGWSPVK